MKELKICANCVHFVPNGLADDDGTQGGYCRRYPPTPMIMQSSQKIVGAGHAGLAGINPPVNADYTCGEYKDAAPHAETTY